MAELKTLLAAMDELQLVEAPATPEDLRAVERRIGTVLPAELVALYERSDGTRVSTPVDRGWVRLWKLSEWRPVREVIRDPKYSAVGDAEVFADHCDESWWYALDVASPKGAIYIVDGLRPPRVVASSVLQFLEDVLADSESIYPKEDSALQQ